MFQDCADVCPKMVTLPSGEFLMGGPFKQGVFEAQAEDRDHLHGVAGNQEAPQHKVRFAYEFAISKFDVTYSDYSTFVRETGYKTPNKCAGADQPDGIEKSGISWRHPGFAESGNDPVVCVSLIDAQAYTVWLSRKTGHAYRLPTEAEWEYAARAGAVGPRYWGEDAKLTCSYANGFDLSRVVGKKFDPDIVPCNDHHEYVSHVGSFKPNSFGLYDMLGNVQQWTVDCQHVDYKGAPIDGTAWVGSDCHIRMARGGSWAFGLFGLRAAARFGYVESFHSAQIGFRIVRDMKF